MSVLVSVIIPAFNASQTIARAISSAQNQTIRDIEILVIDDGSQDATADLAEEAAARDPRIAVIRQANAGVAAARNVAIAQASGQFIAPLDADDIWHPAKLERQIAAFRAAPAGTGLVYNWYRRIDAEERVRPGSAGPLIEGWVFHRHLEWNFISNGSNLLVPTDLARSTGYVAPLPGAGQQGAEDYLFQLRIARTHRFACVPAWLTGYRVSENSLSTKVGAMLRAHLAMYAKIEAECALQVPTVAPVIARRRAQLQVELARNRLRRGAAGEACALLGAALVTAPVAGSAAVLGQARMAFARTMQAAAAPHPASRFEEYGPEDVDGPWRPLRRAALLEWLTRLDERDGP